MAGVREGVRTSDPEVSDTEMASAKFCSYCDYGIECCDKDDGPGGVLLM